MRQSRRRAWVEQFGPDEVAIVHCVQRCVQRAFLAGQDQVTGRDYGFRREWLRRRLHVILRTRPDVVPHWSDDEVALLWLKVFPVRRLEEHLGEPTTSDVQALVADEERLAEVRRRLSAKEKGAGLNNILLQRRC